MQLQATDKTKLVGAPVDATATGVATTKLPFVQPKLTFVQPKLIRQGALAEITQAPPGGFLDANFSGGE